MVSAPLNSSNTLIQDDAELFELAPGVYLVTDESGLIQAANLMARELLGEDLVGRNFSEIVETTDQSRYQSLLQRMQREFSVKGQELLLRPIGGKNFEAGISLVAVQANQNLSLRWWIQDIGQRRQTEMHLRRTQQQMEKSIAELMGNLRILEDQLKKERDEKRRTSQTLARSESRFRNLVQHSSDLIAILEGLGKVLYCSPSVTRILGYVPEDWLDRNYFEDVHPDDVAMLQSHFTQVLDHPGFSSPIVCRKRHKNGEWIYLESIYNNLLHDSSVQGIVINSRDISERRQAELVLQSTMDQLRAVLDAVPGAVSWVSADLRYLGVNRQLAAAFNQPIEAFVGHEVGFLETSPEFPAFVREFFHQPELTMSKEVRVEIEDQPHIFLIVGEKYMQGQAGIFVGVDITELRKTEQMAEIRQSLYEMLLSALPDLTLRLQGDGTFLAYKPAVTSSLKLPAIDPIGKKIIELLPEELAKPAMLHLQRTLQTGQMQIFEFQLLGDYDFEARIVPAGPDQVVAIVRDVTGTKRAIAATTSADPYRQWFDHNAEGLFQVTPTGEYLRVNLALARLYGYDSPEEFLTYAASILPPTQMYADPNRRREFLEAVGQSGQVVNFESQVYRKDGSLVWVSESAHGVKSAQGEVLYYQGSVLDISDRKQLEEALAGVCQELLTEN